MSSKVPARGPAKVSRVKQSLHGFGFAGGIGLLNGKSPWILLRIGFEQAASSGHRGTFMSQPKTEQRIVRSRSRLQKVERAVGDRARAGPASAGTRKSV